MFTIWFFVMYEKTNAECWKWWEEVGISLHQNKIYIRIKSEKIGEYQWIPSLFSIKNKDLKFEIQSLTKQGKLEYFTPQKRFWCNEHKSFCRMILKLYLFCFERNEFIKYSTVNVSQWSLKWKKSKPLSVTGYCLINLVTNVFRFDYKIAGNWCFLVVWNDVLQASSEIF